MWSKRFYSEWLAMFDVKKTHCTHDRVFKDARIHLLCLVNDSTVFKVRICALDCCWGEVFLSGHCFFDENGEEGAGMTCDG